MLTMSMTKSVHDKNQIKYNINNVEKVRNKRSISSNSRNNISIIKFQMI